jgi:hypothetical protein
MLFLLQRFHKQDEEQRGNALGSDEILEADCGLVNDQVEEQHFHPPADNHVSGDIFRVA